MENSMHCFIRTCWLKLGIIPSVQIWPWTDGTNSTYAGAAAAKRGVRVSNKSKQPISLVEREMVVFVVPISDTGRDSLHQRTRDPTSAPYSGAGGNGDGKHYGGETKCT